MRLSLWLILIFAFSVGMCCAFAVRFFYFEVGATAVPISESTTKILVAKRTIPSGIEITADFVAFQEVPVSEVPTGSLTSFAQVYRRQPAFPIPAGCPICEDLLFPQAATTTQAAFVPTGSQIVVLDIVHVRQGNRVFPPTGPLSTVLSVDQYIDVRVVPPEAQGRLAEKKNEVIRTFGAQNMRNSGELILENIPIHRIQRLFAADHAGLARDSLELMLDNGEASRLTAAARRGQIRILVRQDEMISQPAGIESVFEIANLPVQESSDPPSLEQSLSLDIPHIHDQEHSSPISAKSDPETPVDYVQRVAPTPADIVDTVLPPTPAAVATMLPLIKAEEVSQNDDRMNESLHSPAASFPMELSTEETNTIRNDGVIAFGTPSFRVITTEPLPNIRQDPISTTSTISPLLTDNPRQEISDHFQSVRTQEIVKEYPPIASTIQFRTPGNVTPVKENPQGSIWQVEESALLPPLMPLIPLMPSTIPPIVMRERAPGYSPFERRAYTVLPNEEDFGKSLVDELQAPQRLIRSSNSRTWTQ